ncbi:hypothetical protein V6N12_050223 [Hibiscus sabdariffa]|uniref:Uncharacterized protein n=1 Tax=Hibiscus sabdariffa TaxID=183260 RepID=A0ABR2GBR9_9ROSI
MRERKADKLMLYLAILSKQCSDQSKTQANLTTEVSAANVERDGLRKEVEHLKTLLEKSMSKQKTMGDSTFEENGDLEETIAKQKVEMENMENSIDALEEEYTNKLAAKERELVGLQVKLSQSRKERHFANSELRKGGDKHLIREIKALKVKLEELETDCNELTDENLELLLKIKETKNDLDRVAMSEHKLERVFLEEKIQKKILREIQSDYNSYIQELESQKIELETEVTDVVMELA